MKKSTSILAILSFLILPIKWAHAATDCNNPCGVTQVLECAGKINGRNQTAEQVYNSLVFGTSTADGFCAVEDTRAVVTDLQKLYYTNFCTKPVSGTSNYPYTSYTNFLAAITDMSNVAGFSGFACTGTTSQRHKEVANLFSTMAQETSGQITKTNDGLYYRYENDSLNDCYSTWTYDALHNQWTYDITSSYKCTNLDSKTQYWGNAANNVVLVSTTNSNVYTKAYWNNATIANGTVSGNKVDLTISPIKWLWSANEAPVAGYKFMLLTDAMKAGYIVGMGAIQLTGTSMMEFFGWYYNTVASTKQTDADINTFIQNFLVDGKLSMEGSFFYWMYRVNGFSRPTLHNVLTGPGTVCNDAAITARLINGGCANYSPTQDSSGTHPGRQGFYQYFLETVIGQTEQEVTYPYNGVTLDNFKCDYPSQPTALETYCYTTVTP